MDVSISEVTQYLRCRRAWDLTSPNRQGLRKIGPPKAILHIGSGVHYALAAQAAGEDWETALVKWYLDEQNRYVRDYRTAVGCDPSTDELDEFTQHEWQIHNIVHRYFARYGNTPLGEKYRIDAVEQTFRVPIPGTDGTFIGTIDAQVLDTTTDYHWIVEHKSFDRKPNFEDLQLRPQFTAYVWAAQALLGKPVAGVLYDGLSRRLPKPPAPLKTGGLSQMWSDSLDWRSYKDAIEEHGFDKYKYQDILTRLTERDAQDVTPFYARYRIPITPAQVARFAEDLPCIYKEMTSDPAIVPNFTSTCNWDCLCRDLCHSIQFGEDTRWLIQSGYTRGSGSQSFKQRDGREVEVDADSYAAAA